MLDTPRSRAYDQIIDVVCQLVTRTALAVHLHRFWIPRTRYGLHRYGSADSSGHSRQLTPHLLELAQGLESPALAEVCTGTIASDSSGFPCLDER